MKKIIFVHGDKGGTGKSMISSILVDYYLKHDTDLLVIEADNTVPDVARRFADQISGVKVSLDDDAENAISNMIEFVEKHNNQRIIVNLPASAGETLDPLASDLIQPAFEALDYEIDACFAIGKTSDSSELAEKSLNTGLVSVATRRVAVLNGFFGEVESFDFSSANARKNWLKNNGDEVFLPRLHDRVMKQTQTGAFSDYLTSNELTIANRILLKRWLEQAHKIAEMIEVDEELETEKEDAA
jgi:RNase H-fold protein (predicted Holliday junction resolvase)